MRVGLSAAVGIERVVVGGDNPDGRAARAAHGGSINPVDPQVGAGVWDASRVRWDDEQEGSTGCSSGRRSVAKRIQTAQAIELQITIRSPSVPSSASDQCTASRHSWYRGSSSKGSPG